MKEKDSHKKLEANNDFNTKHTHTHIKKMNSQLERLGG